MSIPKIIHYCWLSGERMPGEVQKCMESWKRNLPDYHIKLWDTSNFDYSICTYTQQAAELKKYAFVSDYIRLYALYQEGGIYLDSDIEVFKTFDNLLDNRAFTGFESGGRIAAWIFASEPKNVLFKELLNYYSERMFCGKDGKMDLTPNTVPVTKILIEHGLKPENAIQRLENITVYPEDFFCAKNPWNGRINITNNTYAMHYFRGSWNDLASQDMPFINNVNVYTADFVGWIRTNYDDDIGIIIYGLGVVGRMVLEQIRTQYPDLVVKCILVSKRDNGWKTLEGIPIVEVEQSADVYRKNIVLVSTTPKYHGAIVEILENHGYSRIFLLGETQMVGNYEDYSVG